MSPCRVVVSVWAWYMGFSKFESHESHSIFTCVCVLMKETEYNSHVDARLCLQGSHSFWISKINRCKRVIGQ